MNRDSIVWVVFFACSAFVRKKHQCWKLFFTVLHVKNLKFMKRSDRMPVEGADMEGSGLVVNFQECVDNLNDEKDVFCSEKCKGIRHQDEWWSVFSAPASPWQISLVEAELPRSWASCWRHERNVHRPSCILQPTKSTTSYRRRCPKCTSQQ